MMGRGSRADSRRSSRPDVSTGEAAAANRAPSIPPPDVTTKRARRLLAIRKEFMSVYWAAVGCKEPADAWSRWMGGLFPVPTPQHPQSQRS